MEKFKGTPGPWYAVNYGGWIHIQQLPFYGESDLLNEDNCSLANQNAHLAASAPELLEALQNLVKWEHGTINHFRAYKDAQAAINKALNIAP